MQMQSRGDDCERSESRMAAAKDNLDLLGVYNQHIKMPVEDRKYKNIIYK